MARYGGRRAVQNDSITCNSPEAGGSLELQVVLAGQRTEVDGELKRRQKPDLKYFVDLVEGFKFDPEGN